MEERFEWVSRGFMFYDRNTSKQYAVIVDKKTGVQYLSTDHSGITVLLDKNGKPLLDSRYSN